ncbi:hypothetical protein AB205_0041530 [Aquarana catesbeiana]|uniref:Uncharacterized protein n=1 Tax=Aquarana catesbeiana TaxID=8400 RepID=A0A2G9Q8D1_AQUCT|nr:hypothetical protein AB205_0041530 [Aquarana catesbeiana]
MSFVEMVEMVDILKRADYDGKYRPYPNPNVRKAKIMAKVVKSLHRNFGLRRSKHQLRKRTSESGSMISIEGSGECCKKVSSCVLCSYSLFLERSCCSMCFSLLLYSLK